MQKDRFPGEGSGGGLFFGMRRVAGEMLSQAETRDSPESADAMATF